MDFKLTYATMFNPPEELHTRFDAGLARVKADLGREYAMIIDNKDVFADKKFEDYSPINTDWLLAVMQKGNEHHARQALAAARQRLSRLESYSLAGTRQTAAKSRCADRRSDV